MVDIQSANEPVELYEKIVLEEKEIDWDLDDPLVSIFVKYCPSYRELRYNKRYTHIGRWPLLSHPGDKEGLLLIESSRGPVLVSHSPGDTAQDKEARIASYKKVITDGGIYNYTVQFFTLLLIPLIDFMSINRITLKPFAPWQEEDAQILDPLLIAFPQTLPRFNVYKEKKIENEVETKIERNFVYYLTSLETYFASSQGRRQKVISSASNDVLLGLIFEQLFHYNCETAKRKCGEEPFYPVDRTELKKRTTLAEYPFHVTAILINKFSNFASLCTDKEDKQRITETIQEFLRFFPNLKDFKKIDPVIQETVCSVKHPAYEKLNKARLGLIEVIMNTPQIYTTIRTEYFEKEVVKIQQKSSKTAKSEHYNPSYKYLENEKFNRENVDPKAEKRFFEEAVERIEQPKKLKREED